MSSGIRRLAFVILACTLAHPSRALSAPPDQPATDTLGDPLPTGARLRLGTLRFHAPASIYDMAVAPNEETLVTFGHQIIAWDAKTGKERWRADPDRYKLNLSAASYGTRAAVFAPDSQYFYTPLAPSGVLLWNVETARTQTVFFKRKDETKLPNLPEQDYGTSKSIEVAPDGHLLAVGNAAGITVCRTNGEVLFEIANKLPAARGEMKGDRLLFGGDYSLTRFSPDGKLLAVITSDAPKHIRVHDVTTGNELRSIALKAKLVRLEFSPDSRKLATTERDSAVRLYAVESGTEIWSHIVPLKHRGENYTSAIACSPDGKLLAVGATDDKIHLLDVARGDEIAALAANLWYPWAVAFSGDGKTLFSTGWDGAIRRWNVAAREQLPLPAGVRATSVCAASPDGRLLAYVDDAGTIRLVDAQGGAELTKLDHPGIGYSQLLFSPDARQLAGGGATGDNLHVTIWDLRAKKVTHRWEWPKGPDKHASVEGLSFTPGGDRLAAAVFRQSAAYIWELSNDKQIAKLKHSEIYGLSFSPDGRALATAGWDKKVRFWSSSAGELLREFAVKDDAAPDANGDQSDTRMYTVCYAPHGDLLATAHLDGKVRVWRAADMSPVSRFQLEGRFIYPAISFSPDGLWLATGAQRGDVSFWDPATGKQVCDIGFHQGYVYTVSFGRDSRTLLTGGEDGVCYQWDLRPRNTRPNTDLDSIWHELESDNPATAWQATWDFRDAQARAVPFLAEKLRAVRTLVDPDHRRDDPSVSERERSNEVEARVAAKDKTVLRTTTARRAISLLADIATPEAIAALKEPSEKSPSDDLRQLALAALQRAKTFNPSK